MNHFSKDLQQTLTKHQEKLERLSLRRLFEEDDKRYSKLSTEISGLYFDYSKTHITQETLALFERLIQEAKLIPAISALFNGETVNSTEKRAALHTSLRAQKKEAQPNAKDIASTRAKMSQIVHELHAGQWLGFSGKPINTIINIGIGGSDLGPRMVTSALKAYQKNIQVKFVANIDGADLYDALATSNPETTVFIVASKSFSTLETLFFEFLKT